jgi:hypothetical protein
VIKTGGQHTGRPYRRYSRSVGAWELPITTASHCHPQRRGPSGKSCFMKSRPGVISRSSCCMSFGYGVVVGRLGFKPVVSDRR